MYIHAYTMHPCNYVHNNKDIFTCSYAISFQRLLFMSMIKMMKEENKF